MSNVMDHQVMENKRKNHLEQIMLEMAELLLKEELITFAEKMRMTQMIREGEMERCAGR